MRLTRKQHRALKRLAGLAYERDLTQALSELGTIFDEWEAGLIDAFALHDAVHRYYRGPARDCWSRYQGAKPTESVPLAVARGVLRPEDIPLYLHEPLMDRADELKEGLDHHGEDEPEA